MPVLSLELAQAAESHMNMRAGAAPRATPALAAGRARGVASDTVTGADVEAGAVTGTAVRARRTLMLAVCCMSLFMVGLDNTIVIVGLPSIGRDLHAGWPACSGWSPRTPSRWPPC